MWWFTRVLCWGVIAVAVVGGTLRSKSVLALTAVSGYPSGVSAIEIANGTAGPRAVGTVGDSTDPNAPFSHAGSTDYSEPGDDYSSLNWSPSTTVFYPDDRTQITDTTRSGYRSVAFLFGSAADGSNYSCSGTFLNYNVVLTAAHCLWTDGAWAHSLRIYPGQNGYFSPYGSAYSTGGWSIPTGYIQLVGNVPGYSNLAAIPYDYGIVYLQSSPFATTIGPFLQIAQITDDYFNQSNIAIGSAGYPGDKAWGTMWYEQTLSASVDATMLYSLLDEYPGQSGSAIFTVDTKTNQIGYILSIVTEGNAYRNMSVRFTPSVIANLQKYCASWGCSFTVAPAPLATPPTPTALYTLVSGKVTGAMGGTASVAVAGLTCPTIAGGTLAADGTYQIVVSCPSGSASLLINGVARATFTLVAGVPAVVNATVPVPVGSVSVSMTPQLAPGSTAIVTAAVRGVSGAAIADGTTVTFVVSGPGNQVSPGTTTTSSGSATATIIAGPITGSYTVTATAGGIPGSTSFSIASNSGTPVQQTVTGNGAAGPFCFAYSGPTKTPADFPALFSPAVTGVNKLVPAGRYQSWFSALPALSTITTITTGDFICVAGPAIGATVFK